jgi:hypothetical protein
MFLMALIWLLNSPPAAPDSAPETALLGQWESAVRTPGGVGNILEFYADGRVTQISAAMGEADYKIEGEWLRSFWKDPATGKTSEVDTRLDFEGNRRFVERGGEESSEPPEAVSERVGDPIPGGSPLLGQWCSKYLELMTSYREFTPERMYNRLPIQTLRGHYSVSGDTLKVQIDGQPPGEYPYRFEKGMLVIKSRDGSDKPYKRPDTALLKGY